MQNNLVLVKLDEDYCNYLRKFDSKVPYNFDKKSVRPFVSVLFYIGKLMYFAPLSSPKPKHLKIKNKIDFLKIDGGRLGAINFNNMLPVTDKNVEKINLNIAGKTKSEKQYNSLLVEQLRWLNRCCDFKLLEEKCSQYNKYE